MDLSNIPIQEISTCVILLPLGLAAFRFKTGDLKIRLFFLFLLLGALVDGLGWFVYGNGLQQFYLHHALFQYCYLFFEAMFFVWLCSEFLHLPSIKQIKTGFLVLLAAAFLIKGGILLGNLNEPFRPSALNSLMDGVFLASISFLSAFALLQIAERVSNILSYPWFWILSGIFFYCFGSFFIDLMLGIGFMDDIWGMRNMVNIIQYIFFITGLCLYSGKSREAKHSPQSTEHS